MGLLKQGALLILPLGGLLLGGCEESRRPAQTEAAKPVPAARTDSSAASRPGARPPLSRLPYVAWYGPRDTAAAPQTRLIVIAGRRWQVRTSALADSSRRLAFPVKQAGYPDTVEQGVEVAYQFGLRNEAGQRQFRKTLHKTDFKAQVYGSLRTVSLAVAPEFLGYWPARHTLVFSVPFIRDGTDEGLTVPVLLDATTGGVLHQGRGNALMNDCSCWPALTADGQTFLAGRELLAADGHAVSLERPRLSLAATRILSDSAFLVAYENPINPEVEPVLSPNNVFVVNQKGKVLKRFTFHGTDPTHGSGGYSLQHQFLPATQTHYLFDGTANSFTLLKRDTPTLIQQISARQMVRYHAPKRRSEVKLEFLPDAGPSADLYVDTLTQKTRCTLTRLPR